MEEVLGSKNSISVLCERDMRVYLSLLVWFGYVYECALSRRLIDSTALEISLSAPAGVKTTACPVFYHQGQHRQDVLPWNTTWATQPADWWKGDYLIPYCFHCRDKEPAVCPACVVKRLHNTTDNCTEFYANDKHMASHSWKLGEVLRIIQDRAKELLPPELFAVNVGAGDGFGGTMDPTFDLFAEHPDLGGLLLDAQTEAHFFHKYPKRDNMKLITGKPNIPSPVDYAKFLQEHKAPKHLTAVKIDIDSWECTIIQNLLHNGYSSVMFHVEFNPTIPLPIRFNPVYAGNEDEYDNSLWNQITPFYGCSLARVADILMPAGYRLIEVDGWDATWVHKKFANLFQPLPADLHTAWFAGWGFRNQAHGDDIPCLFNDRKLHHSKLAHLGKEVARAIEKKDQVTIDLKMSHIRVILDEAASHKTLGGSPHPYLLEYTGAYEDHLHQCRDQRQ